MLIGFSGKAWVGKTTAAKYLEKEHGAIRLSFAAEVKREVRDFLLSVGILCPSEYLYGQKEKDKKIFFKPRKIVENPSYEYLQFLKDFIKKYAYYDGQEWVYFTGRQLLQWWGTDLRRKQDEDYWINQIPWDALASDRLYVFDDVRFPNEFKAIAERHGLLVKIIRPNVPEEVRYDHSSETALDAFKFHCEIMNNREVENLYVALDIIIASFTQ